MTSPRRSLSKVLALALLLGGLWTRVWSADPATPATSGSDRSFLTFAEEAAVASMQWWEGQLRYTDDSPFDTLEARLVAAFQPWKNVELGGRVGFGNTDASGSLPDGTGATDLDVWGKYLFAGIAQDADFAAGALVTVPTGDDTAGLGHNAWDVEVFGSVRFRTPQVIIGGLIGLGINGDGKIGGSSFSGKNSFFLGGSVIIPASDRVSFVGEIQMETERIEGSDEDFRALAGVDWRAFARGSLRGAAGFGLTDGAPNVQITLGYAATF